MSDQLQAEREEARLNRSLNRPHGANSSTPVRKGSTPTTPNASQTIVNNANNKSPESPSAATVASTVATVSGWRERRAEIEKERAEKEKIEIETRRVVAHGEVVAESVSDGVGRDEREIVELESTRIERRFNASLENAVRVERPAVFHFSAKFDRDWNVQQFDADVFVRRLCDEINALRADPTAWCATLEELRACFDGTVYRSPTNSDVKNETEEGVAAVQEAISVLRGMTPLAPLAVVKGMSASCASFTDTQREQLTAPVGAKARRELHGSSHAYVELLNVGGATPKEVVCQWLVSDGNETRKNRKALLNPAATHIGASAVRNKGVFQITFAALAEKFVEK